MIVTVTCPQCEQEFSREFDDSKLARLKAGELVKDVFPELSLDERDLFFITHICPKCWDEWNGLFSVIEPKGYEEDADIPQGMLDEMADDHLENTIKMLEKSRERLNEERREALQKQIEEIGLEDFIRYYL